MKEVDQMEQARTPRPRGIILTNLKRVRERKGLSLRELEELTENQGGKRVYRSTINELENLERGAHGRTVRKLSEALGVSTEDLVG